MARFDSIKQTIDSNIKSNGNQEITGQKLNAVLNGMMSSVDAALTAVEDTIPEAGSASGSSARELYMDFTGQGLTDEQKAYNAETFTLLQTQAFSMFLDEGGSFLYPIYNVSAYTPGTESIRLQCAMHNTDESFLSTIEFTLTQDGILTFFNEFAYKLTPYTGDEDTENTGEYEEKLIVRELRVNVNDINQNYNAATYEKAIKGINKEGPLPMLFYNGGRGDMLILLTVCAGANLYDPNTSGWDFVDSTKPFIGFVSPILGRADNTLMQVRVALYEDGSNDTNNWIINIPTQ